MKAKFKNDSAGAWHKIANSLLSLAAAVSVILSSVVNCFAADVNYSLVVDDKVQTGKSFVAKISVSGNYPVSAMIFTLCFDPSVMEFSSASLCGGDGGQMEEYCENGALKIVYLNTRGVSANGETDIVEVKFKAFEEPCTAFLTLYGEQAVSADEKRLSCAQGFEYAVELQEKISGNVGRADAVEVKGTASSSNSSSKSSSKGTGSSKAASSKSTAKSSSSYGTRSAEQYGGASLGSSSGSAQSDSVMFICGAVAAICVACAAAGIYAFGKKRGEMKRDEKENEKEEEKESFTEDQE